jgi:site-specific DNA-methyltransferase (adenine-specific)
VTDLQTNVLYYGDNLDILRRYIPDASVDLIYLDPPFNSNRDYNVIFKDESGKQSDASIKAFEDTWHWGPSAESTYAYLTNTLRHEGRVPDTVSTIIAALRSGIGENQMMAYLVEMAVRLVELHRVLKPTGSLYLHCDPTASHYLKLLLDAIFGPERFGNEIVWRRSNPKSHGTTNFANVTDTLLRYTASSAAFFRQPYGEHDPGYVDSAYRHVDDGGRYRLLPLLNPNKDRPNLTYEFLGVTRVWRWTKERMEAAHAEGLVVQTRPGAVPQYKKYLEDSKGRTISNLWTDIEQADGKERLGFPTQKPLGLLERIIESSSKRGDLVLDPFCGCGTALVAAQKLERRWIGIDITYLSIAVMKARLRDSFGVDVPVIGQPTEVGGARQLAESLPDGRYQFQWWALNLVDAKPVGGVEKKGADKGVDGVITFSGPGGKMERVIVSVKSGHVNPSMVQALKGAMETQGAAMGLFITLEEPTAQIKQEATVAGFYHSELADKDYPRVQVLSIRELLEEGKKPMLPLLVLPTFEQAERIDEVSPGQQELFG